MFPMMLLAIMILMRFLCLRRDVSRLGARIQNEEGFSLLAQRCFWDGNTKNPPAFVFSAYTEMFLPQEVKPMIRQGFFCLRRDVSKVIEFNGSKIMFSLLAEMFLPRRRSRQTNGGSLCLRRDVSLLLERRTAYNMFSLHAQRCFLHSITWDTFKKVFSACAEMFPTHNH